VNNSKQPVKSSDFHFSPVNYSPLFQARNGCGEQVPFAKFWKNFVAARRQTAAFFKKTKAALCREAATPKKLLRAIHQRRSNAGSCTIIALTIVALTANLEIIAIHFLMNTPPVDVRSIFALRKR
jgi:hypothetical protein